MSAPAGGDSDAEDTSVLSRAAPPPDQRLAYGEHADQYAQVWQGAGNAAAQRPLVLLAHGGYWRPAYDLQHMAPMAAALAAAGWTVANVEYRRIPGDPAAALDDLREASERLPRRIPRHDRRVLLAGFSAGGHLALMLAASARQLHAVLALAPVASARRAQELHLSNDAVEEFVGGGGQRIADWDPVTQPDPAMPVFIVHGETDGRRSAGSCRNATSKGTRRRS